MNLSTVMRTTRTAGKLLLNRYASIYSLEERGSWDRWKNTGLTSVFYLAMGARIISEANKKHIVGLAGIQDHF